MMISQDRIALVVGAVIAVLLQIVVAPYIAIGSAFPNFIVVYTILVAITRAYSFGAVFPFVMGLLFDLLTGGPLGLMAFSLTAFSYLVARLFGELDNDTLFIPLAMGAFGLLLVEVSYGVFLLLFGFNASLVDALAYRALPCFVYDLVIAVILYPVVARFLRQSAPIRSSITRLR